MPSHNPRKYLVVLSALVALLVPFAWSQTKKPPLTLDDFFNSVSIDHVRLSPDGHSLIVATERAALHQREIEGSLSALHRSQSGANRVNLRNISITSTVSFACPTCNAISARAFWLTCKVMPVCMYLRNPGCSIQAGINKAEKKKGRKVSGPESC